MDVDRGKPHSCHSKLFFESTLTYPTYEQWKLTLGLHLQVQTDVGVFSHIFAHSHALQCIYLNGLLYMQEMQKKGPWIFSNIVLHRGHLLMPQDHQLPLPISTNFFIEEADIDSSQYWCKRTSSFCWCALMCKHVRTGAHSCLGALLRLRGVRHARASLTPIGARWPI